MLFVILEHVDERVANLARTPQLLTVPTICPETPSPLKQGVHTTCHANHQATDTRRKRAGICTLDNQVQVTLLH